MARLTRTQKYADLREQMANDREESLVTDELKAYEDKLKSVNANISSGIERQGTFINAQPKSPVDYSSYGSFEQEIKPERNLKLSEQINNYQNEIKDDNPFNGDTVKINDDNSFYDFLSSLDAPVQEEVKEEPKAPIAEFEQPEVVKPVEFEQPEVIKPVEFEQPEAVKPVIEKEPEIINDVQEDIDDIVKQLEDDFDLLNSDFDHTQEIAKAPVADINNNYLTETLKEVNEHNKNDGLTTKEEIASNMVNAIRHPGQPVNANNADDEFSNTVTLEIDKVLNELNSEPEIKLEPVYTAPVEPEVKPEPVYVAPVEPEIKPEPVKVEPAHVKVELETIHPVLTKTIEEEVVEIKPMEETLTQEVLDDTIPFNISNDNEEIIEDYEEDEAPNKVLNIILIVLIVILLAILGVIVYYILFAKGIIG